MFSSGQRLVAGGSSMARRDGVATPHPWTKMRASKKDMSSVMRGFKLIEAPLDIILEIFGYLHPMDLLSLARTYKQLRQFLMTEDSKPVWRTARGNIKGLPECPAHLSEPAYANLAFDPHCHNCLAPGPHDVFWELSARYCTDCVRPSSVEVVWTDAYAKTYIRFSLGFVPDIELEEYIPFRGDGTVVLFRMTECVRFVRGLADARRGEAAMKHFLTAAKERADQMQLHADACREWYTLFLEERLYDIVAKLACEHWTHPILEMLEADGFEPLTNLPIVRHPRVLTDAEWRDIRDPIVEVVNEYQQAKLAQQRRDTTTSRLQLLRQTYSEHLLSFDPHNVRTRALEYGPRFADIALLPAFRAHVEAGFAAHVDADTFKDELAHLPALAGSFTFRRELALSDKIAQALGCQTWMGILERAVAWFHCAVCAQYVRWPEVLAHLCQRPHYGACPRDASESDCYPYEVAEVGGFHGWSAETLHPIDPEDLVNLRSLIAACGLDPETANADQMDALDMRVTYKRTSARVDRSSTAKVVMNWRRAVLSLPTVRGCAPVQWARLSEVEKRTARPYEMKAHRDEARLYKYTKFMWCALCDEPWWLVTDVHGDPFLIAYHLRRSHHVEAPDHELKEKYMYMHPDGDVVTPAVWISR